MKVYIVFDKCGEPFYGSVLGVYTSQETAEKVAKQEHCPADVSDYAVVGKQLESRHNPMCPECGSDNTYYSYLEKRSRCVDCGNVSHQNEEWYRGELEKEFGKR